MLVVMKAHATPEQVSAVCSKIESLGYRAHSIPGAERTAIGITGNQGEVQPGTLEEMPGVQEVIPVTKSYKLVSRDMKAENTVISFPGTDATFGGSGLAIVAGPCAIESREQAFAVAEFISATSAGIASAEAATSNKAEMYPKRGLLFTGGWREASHAAAASVAATCGIVIAHMVKVA